ncbi:MAG TPA: hypothetical protein VFJ13_04070 [Paracoccaceae bacterium]|nr:hypothetical protein [Paracoccaceae bacterium]
MQGALIAVWQLGSVVTFVYLTFFDGYVYNAWNWLIAIPVNIFLGEIWPIYWLILRPIFGA